MPTKAYELSKANAFCMAIDRYKDTSETTSKAKVDAFCASVDQYNNFGQDAIKSKSKSKSKSINTTMSMSTGKTCLERFRGTLLPWQFDLAKFMIRQRGAIVAYDIGRSTAAIVSGLCALENDPDIKKVIVTVPISNINIFKRDIEQLFNIVLQNVAPQVYRGEHIILAGHDAFDRQDLNCSDAIVIIDDAHKFATNTHFTDAGDPRKKVDCARRAKKVILLTMTPFIAEPYDMENLIAMATGEAPISRDEFYEMVAWPPQDNPVRDPEAFRRHFSCIFAFQEQKPDAPVRVIRGPKLAGLAALLKKKQKTVVFATSDIPNIEALLRAEGFNPQTITGGGMTLTQRGKVVDAYNTDQVQALILTANVPVPLRGTKHLIFYSPPPAGLRSIIARTDPDATDLLAEGTEFDAPLRRAEYEQRLYENLCKIPSA